MGDHSDIDHSGLTGVGTGDHGALTGLSDDDHPQYVKDSEFGAKGRILVGTGSGTFDDLAAGTNGYILTADSGEATGTKWAPNAGAADILDLPTAETDDTLVLAPDGAGGVEFRAESGGGGGSISGDAKPSARTKPVSPTAYDDEFDDATGMSGPGNGLNARWTKHNLGTAGWTRLNDSYAPGCAQFAIPSGQSGDQAIYQTVPAGDFAIEAMFDFRAIGERQIWGIFCVDSSGNGVAMSLDYTQASAGARLMVLSSWAQTATVHTSPHPLGEGVPYRLHLRKASGVYFGDYSNNDRDLFAGRTSLERTLTPSAFTAAYIGFGRFYGGSNASLVNLDYFRRVA